MKASSKLHNTSKAPYALFLGDEASKLYDELTDGRVITESA
jgi:hypothetical protein